MDSFPKIGRRKQQHFIQAGGQVVHLQGGGQASGEKTASLPFPMSLTGLLLVKYSIHTCKVTRIKLVKLEKNGMSIVSEYALSYYCVKLLP